jgi:hypothetical protein
MRAPQDEAAEYRKQAAACVEVAERMSLNSDKQRMIDMSLYWLSLAEKADARHGYQSMSGKDQGL